MKDPDVSPGWTRPVITTHFLEAMSWGSLEKSVIIKDSKSFPASVFPRVLFLTRSEYLGAQARAKKNLRSVYV